MTSQSGISLPQVPMLCQERVEGGVLARPGRGSPPLPHLFRPEDERWGGQVVPKPHPGSPPFLSLQPGRGTGSWALPTRGSTTWRSQTPSCLTTLPTSARPRRPPCAPGGPSSPCSVMIPHPSCPQSLPMPHCARSRPGLPSPSPALSSSEVHIEESGQRVQAFTPAGHSLSLPQLLGRQAHWEGSFLLSLTNSSLLSFLHHLPVLPPPSVPTPSLWEPPWGAGEQGWKG